MFSVDLRRKITILLMTLGGVWGLISIILTIEYIESEFIETTKGILIVFPVFCANMFIMYLGRALSLLLPKSILQSQPVSLIMDPLLIPFLAIAFGILFGWLLVKLILWISDIYGRVESRKAR